MRLTSAFFFLVGLWIWADIVHAQTANQSIPVLPPGAIAQPTASATADAQIAPLRAKLQNLPSDAPIHVSIGQVLIGAARFDDAAAEFHAALANEPALVSAHDGLGFVLAREGKFDEAVQELREAIRLDSDQINQHTALLSALAASGRLAAIEPEVVAAISRGGVNEYFYHNILGVIRKGQARFDDATAEYRAAVDHAGQNVTVAVSAESNVGWLLLNAHRDDEAIQAFHHAVELVPPDKIQSYGLAFLSLKNQYFSNGQMLQQQGKLDAAIEQYLQCIAVSQNVPMPAAGAHNNVAIIYASQGKKDKAIEEYRETLRLMPTFTPAKLSLDKLLNSN